LELRGEREREERERGREEQKVKERRILETFFFAQVQKVECVTGGLMPLFLIILSFALMNKSIGVVKSIQNWS
jgi:hypothetical protein